MNAKSNIVVTSAPGTAGNMSVEIPKKHPETSSHSLGEHKELHLSNSDRATTITVVLEKILAKTDFPHGGINE